MKRYYYYCYDIIMMVAFNYYQAVVGSESHGVCNTHVLIMSGRSNTGFKPAPWMFIFLIIFTVLQHCH